MTQFFELTAEKQALGPRGQIIGDDRLLIRAGLILLVFMTVWKLYIALITNVLWDEAHFVMSGAHPDLAYPDIPAGYPWLARLITSVAGWSILPLRLVSLAIATAIPFAVWFMARPVTSPRNAVWAAILALLCPAVTNNGPIFYPEGGLQLLLALMAGCLLRALIDGRMKWWIWAGVCAGLGLLVHYRFVVPGLAVFAFLLVHPLGRRQWTRPGLYVTAGLALLGLLPSLIYNVANDWPALQFHVVQRPRYTFSLEYVVEFVMKQIFMANPVFFFAMAMGAKAALWDERDKPAALLGYLGVGVFAFYAVQALFNKSVMPHWPWLAFVPLLALAPGVLIGFADRAASAKSRTFRTALIALGPALTVVFAGLITLMQYVNANEATVPYSLRGLDSSKHENWALVEPNLSDAVARAEARFGSEVAIAVNGHASAVHLEFPAVKGRQVYTLNDPDDLKTRFVQARSQWNLDRAALVQGHAGEGVVLVLNSPDYVYHEGDGQVEFYKDVCGLFDDIEPFGVTELPPGRVALHLYTARVRATPKPFAGPCVFLPSLYIGQPMRGAFLTTEEDGNYFGVAADSIGITKVDVIIDGQVVAPTRYGLDPEGARMPDVLAFDPNYPRVQFDFKFPAGALKPGDHKLSIRATRSDGSTVDSLPRTIYVK
ncbi:glycosyltransferase family 39 protein [Asticcacaulis biprosthecium]|uniref:glycosyltransferase family 39 protein n=1 Tax=Asticcacaulis biprosthecium TaxID=76891 RepID=UPI0002DA02C0|nr:glycosyltransferase family 39 protein [Asticcacaulis biprosthecium]